MSVKGNQRDKLERLCRYMARPAVSIHRLSLTADGHIRYELKTPYRNGTTHFIFQPMDFISKLAALVPAPRVNLIRFHGAFAPNSKHRAQIVPHKSHNKVKKVGPQTEFEKYAAMNWAKRLKRAFQIDIETCEACGGTVKVVACIDDPTVIDKMLIHLNHYSENNQHVLPINRAPPLLI